MPYLMLKDKEGKTPLQVAIENKDVLMTTNLLDLLIRGDKKGVIYSGYINPHLFELKKLGIDLKPFLNS
jgi:ankyrin repeat protein